jgi:magnesium transporter
MIQTLKKGGINLTPVEAADLEKSTIFEALWIDLMAASDEEHKCVEKALDISIPSKEEMLEIEESSRLFKIDGALYMSCWLLCYDSPIPRNASVTFIVTKTHFLSIRHTDHHAFRVFTPSVKRKHPRRAQDCGEVFAELMDAITGHIAYTLRLVEQDLNELSVEIFAEQKGHLAKVKQIGLKKVVKRLGKRNSLVSNLRESSVSLSTIAPFFAANAEAWITPDTSSKLTTLKRDIKSLDEYNVQLSSEIAFLLDSTVGLINFEQNQVMKWLGAAAIVVTLVP